jgi:hypothetical protein
LACAFVCILTAVNLVSRNLRIIVLAFIAALGAWLRMHDLGRQIPIDDEWHGLDFALSRDAWFLLTHFSRAGANSVPYNVYLRVLLSSAGWSETTIVLPSLLGGIALLWFFPNWVWRRFGVMSGIVAAVALAISPFLVFYSRVARAYSAQLFFQTIAIVALAEWLRDGRRRDAILFTGSAALAIWMHAMALPALVTAAAVAALLCWRRLRQVPEPRPPLRATVTAGLGMLALSGLLWLPALLSPMPEVFHPSGRLALAALPAAWQLVCGTASSPLAVLCLLLFLSGVLLALRQRRREVLLLVSAVAGCVLSVIVARPNESGVAGVFVRYSMASFPLFALALGIAAQAMVDALGSATARVLAAGAVAAFLVALLLRGPLPSLYGRINSFTKHPAFGFDVHADGMERARPDPLAPTAEPPLRRADLQPFYAELARTPGRQPIIEYPFLLGEDANLFYFAQQVHGRPVLAGYRRSGATEQDVFGFAVTGATGIRDRPPSLGYITNAMMIDHVLGRRPDNPGFRTIVAIDDAQALARSHAEYVVLHWNLLREFFHIGPDWAKSAFVAQARAKLSGICGAPILENEVITVFRLTGSRCAFPTRADESRQ